MHRTYPFATARPVYREAGAFASGALRKLGLAMAFALVGTASAFAHAHLVRAVPGSGTHLNPAPAQVQIWFSEAVEPAFSSIKVIDTNRKQVETGKSEAGPDASLRLMLPPLQPGAYEVVWRVVSVDTHASEGHFSFTVGP